MEIGLYCIRLRLEWKFQSYCKIISVSCLWLSIPCNSDLATRLPHVWLCPFCLSFVYITCIYLGKQGHSWQPNRYRRWTTFGWSPGPILVAKFGPARTIIGKGRPFLATRSGPGGTFLTAKIGPGDHFWAGPIFASQVSGLWFSVLFQRSLPEIACIPPTVFMAFLIG